MKIGVFGVLIRAGEFPRFARRNPDFGGRALARLRYNPLMTTEKQAAIELIDRLPDDISTETIITELQFRLTIMRRAHEAAVGERVIPHDEAKDRLGRWLDSSGT